MNIQWIGGAGFIIRFNEKTICIDPYLSDILNRGGSYKRLTVPPVTPECVMADVVIASHEHGDHLDEGSIGKLVPPDGKTKLLCPSRTADEAIRLGISEDLILRFDRGQTYDGSNFAIRAVFSDHAEQSVDAIGVFLTLEGKTIYFMGDTCFRTDMYDMIAPVPPIDVLLVPINGKFGNPDARDAAYYAQMFSPKIVIPCHFWLFTEHGGDPGEFKELCSVIAPNVEVKILAIGEELTL